VKSPKRLKLVAILGLLAGSTLALVAWSQTWGSVSGNVPGGAEQQIVVTGAVAAPAVTALALAGFALAGALTIAGPIIRLVLGVLQLLLGFSVGLAAWLALTDFASVSASAIVAATGLTGQSTMVGMSDPVLTIWPWVALAAAVVMFLAGLFVIVTSRVWPGSERRSRSRFEPVESSPASGSAEGSADGSADTGSAVSDWDGLTRGNDPTA
jgi:uncharacterized membrane protein (TIGR02234 family)